MKNSLNTHYCVSLGPIQYALASELTQNVQVFNNQGISVAQIVEIITYILYLLIIIYLIRK